MQDSIVADGIIAGVTLLFIVYTAIGGARDYKKLVAATNPEQRLRFFRKWTLELLVLTLGGVAALLITGRAADVITFPVALAPAHDVLSRPIGAVVLWLCFAAFCAVMVAPLIKVSGFAPNETNAKRARKTMAAAPMLARDARERAWVTVMCLLAGLGEELVFRLLFPVALLSLTHNLLAALLISTVAFAIGHAYHGLVGVLMVFLTGALVFGVYLATQTLWLVMVFHALIDLKDFALLSWMLERLARAETSTAQP